MLIHRYCKGLKAPFVHLGAEFHAGKPGRYGGVGHRPDKAVEKPQVPAGLHFLDKQPVRPGAVENVPDDLLPGKGDVGEFSLSKRLREPGQLVL